MTESDLKILKEAEESIKKADELVKRVLDQLSLEELIDFNVYRDQIKSDYQSSERARIRESFGKSKDVSFPKNRKLPGQETKTWWPRIQGLFAEDEGQTMNFSVASAVDRYLHVKSRDNPIY